MKDIYTDKLFENSHYLADSDEWVDKIKIIQIGETCLDKGASIAEHIQNCNEITFVLSGEGILCSDEEEVKCSSGDIQLVSKGVKHKITSSLISSLRYIHFAFNFEENYVEELPEFYKNSKNVILKDNGEIRFLLNMLVDEYFNKTDYDNVIKNGLVQIILIKIWRQFHNIRNEKRMIFSENPIGKTVYEITKYIDKNALNKLTVKEIAEKFSYSESYISHLFKEKTGVSLREYIIASKMQFAKKMLCEGKSSLTEISTLTGYETVQAFCKIFKKYTGHTPSEIKKGDK